jgi:hypothetical protein
MRKFGLMLAVSLLVAVVAACGGSSSKDKTVTPGAASDKSPAASQTPTADASKDETAFAKSMLLTAADFPSGWVETPNTTNDEANPLNAVCGKATEQGKTGRATSSDFAADANSPTISEVVIVFGTDGDASAAIDAVPALVDCAVKAINDGKLDNSGVEFSGATSKKVTVAAPGDKTYAFQITTTGKVTGQAGSEQTLYFTLVFAKKGRVGYQISAQGSGALPDPADDAPYAQKAAEKIKQQP